MNNVDRSCSGMWLAAVLTVVFGSTVGFCAEPAVCPAVTTVAPAAPPVAWWARPSDTGHYCGYYVGGGSLRRGDPPTVEQGVWGWDYSGWLYHPRIALLWSYGRPTRADIGSYRTTGCKKGESPSSP